MARPAPPSHRVFLSGTNVDLEDYKAAAIGVFGRLGLPYKQQRDYQQTGLGTDALHWSEDLMRGTDWYVLIVALRYGTVVSDPETQNRFSVTEMEYRHARRTSARRFVFMSEPANFRDALAMNRRDTLPTGGQDFDKAKRLEAFRTTLTANDTVVDFFQDLADFRLKLERSLTDALQIERDERIKEDADRITNQFNDLLARKNELLRRVMDLDERFQLNQTRLDGVTLLKKMHDGIHIARQEGIRPLREVTFPEWKKDNLSDAVLRQLKSARHALVRLHELEGFYAQFIDAVAKIASRGAAFSESRARFREVIEEFFQALEFAAGVADYRDLPALQVDLKRFVDVLENTFGLLSSELKLGADMLNATNKTIELEVENAIQDPTLQLSAADAQVVRDRISLLRVRTQDLHKVIRGHDEWQWVHDRLTAVDGGRGSDGHCDEILKVVCDGGRVDRQLQKLVLERRTRLGELVIQQYISTCSSAPKDQRSLFLQLREARRAIQRNELRLAQSPASGQWTYLRRIKCVALFSHLARLRAFCERKDERATLGPKVETTYAIARKEFDDQFFDVDTELSQLCADLSKKVHESLAALRQIDLAANLT